MGQVSHQTPAPHIQVSALLSIPRCTLLAPGSLEGSHETGAAADAGGGRRGTAAVRQYGGGGDVVRRDAADTLRGHHHRERRAYPGVLQQREGADAVHVHLRPQRYVNSPNGRKVMAACKVPTPSC
jgi:hypothetical protein